MYCALTHCWGLLTATQQTKPRIASHEVVPPCLCDELPPAELLGSTIRCVQEMRDHVHCKYEVCSSYYKFLLIERCTDWGFGDCPADHLDCAEIFAGPKRPKCEIHCMHGLLQCSRFPFTSQVRTWSTMLCNPWSWDLDASMPSP